MRQTDEQLEENIEDSAVKEQRGEIKAVVKRGIMALNALVITITLLVANLYFAIPSKVMLHQGDEYIYALSYQAQRASGTKNMLSEDVQPTKADISFSNAIRVSAQDVGDYKVEVTTLGAIPVKTMEVSVVPRQMVVPLGIPVGLKIEMDGVMVVGVADIKVNGQDVKSPAEQAGVLPGDIITEIGGTKIVNSDSLINSVVNCQGRSLPMTVSRDGDVRSVNVSPAFEEITNEYKLGIWVRDGITGIGTMSFYDPASGKYAALGHGITDVDTGKLLNVKQGKILPASIVNVKKGEKGSPGELKGHLSENGQELANIKINNSLGVYGYYNKDVAPNKESAMPVALRNQIQPGPAEILAISKGDTPEMYSVEIEKVFYNERDTNKGMIIKITDQRLLNQTGGIVQGMSGSPIIQNNMVAGAVTHVFINDPQRGYGTFIDTMIEQMQAA